MSSPLPPTASNQLALDLLLGRLSWPVPLVRWRAARGLRDLIQDPATCQGTTEALLEHLGAADVESDVCTILTIFLMADAHSLPNPRAVIERIKHPSILAEIMLRQIYRTAVTLPWWIGHSGPVPADFEARDYFEEYKTQHVPVVLSTHLRKLGRTTGLPLIRQWAFEWQELSARTDARYSEYPYYFDDVGEVRAGIVGQYSPRQSDMFRSAYLRTFAIAVAQWGFPASEAGYYVSELLPAIRGIFDLDPVARPAWLQDLPERCAVAPDQLEALMRAFVAEVGDDAGRLVSLHAPVAPDVARYADLSLTAYLVTDDYQPGKRALYEPTDILVTHDTFQLDRVRPVNSIMELRQPGASGDALPVCCALFPVPFGSWHGHYYSSGIPIPASYVLPAEPTLRAHPDRIAINLGRAQVASTHFWLDRWTPRYPRDHGQTRCGRWAILDASFLTDHAAALDRKLAWSARLRIWAREKQFENYARSEHTIFFRDQQLGAT